MRNWAGLARTVVATASTVDLGIMGARAPLTTHATDDSGALLFSLTEAAPDCAHLVVPGSRGPVVHAVASDVSTVAHAGRLRGRVALAGRASVMTGPVREDLRAHLGLGDGDLVGRLVPDTVTLEWFVERPPTAPEVHVDAGDYALAPLDALAGWQDEWIAHLDAHHREPLRELVARDVQPVSVVRPVLADEEGLVLREHVGTCRRDLRVDFPQRVRCGCEAVAALKDLVTVRSHL